ncbi:MAG: di-heme oxidoredictase family protein [Planctomycetota bacterium]
MKKITITGLVGSLVLVGALVRPPAGEGSSFTFESPVPPVGTPGGTETQLSGAPLAQWLRGRVIFDRDFHHTAGLGTPDFNADSCRACHADPGLGGAGGLELNVARFGQDMGSGFVDLAGGQAASKLRPPVMEGDFEPREEMPPLANVYEQRQTPSILGDGLLDDIAESVILANQDPTDANADGIFGVARIVSVGGGQTAVGRFGWKAQIPSLLDFAHDAVTGEIGLTVPDNGRGFGALTDLDTVADPEITNDDLADLVFFMRNLAAPRRKNSQDPAVAEGEMLFTSVGCAKCHLPSLQGPNGPVRAYTNLLLHNVQSATFSGMAEPGAGSGMYRTPPLWGISETGPWWHDGRGETLFDTIYLHEGEATAVTAAFDALTESQKMALLAFLNDL